MGDDFAFLPGLSLGLLQLTRDCVVPYSDSPIALFYWDESILGLLSPFVSSQQAMLALSRRAE